MKPGTVKRGPASVKVSISKAVPEQMRSRVRELSSLVVDAAQRGHGYARALMDEMMQQADDAGYVLLVIVEPFDESPLDVQKLEHWYESLGFVRIQDEPVIMARQPVTVH